MKKPERPWRPVSNFDEDVLDYTCEYACVNDVNVKSAKRCSPGGGGGGGGAATGHKNTLRVTIYCSVIIF